MLIAEGVEAQCLRLAARVADGDGTGLFVYCSYFCAPASTESN